MRKSFATALKIAGFALGVILGATLAFLSWPDIIDQYRGSHPERRVFMIAMMPFMLCAGIYWLFNFVAKKIDPESKQPQ